MTEREERIIRNYLVKAEVEYMEFYEELYDHIATSFNNRPNKEQSLHQHLELDISSAFGGQEGIAIMLRKQSKFMNSNIYRHGWQVFHSFFTTVKGVLKTFLILGMLYLLESLDKFDMIMDLSALLILIPYGITTFAQWQFKRKCKANNLPYQSSLTNSTIFGLTSGLIVFAFALPSLIGKVFMGQGFYTLEYLAQFEFLTFPLTLLLTLYAITCLTLTYKKIQLKPIFT